MNKRTLNITVSLRMNGLKVSDLQRRAAEETLKRGRCVKIQDLLREAIEEKYFKVETANGN